MHYVAVNGHHMVARTTHTDKAGREVWDHWTATHSTICPCLTSEDW